MTEKWHPKLGDRVIRRPRIRRHLLRRALGVTGLWATAYGDLGSSIYYALGIVTVVALGAAPLALIIAGVIFFLNALTYAEGTAMLPEAGGSASFARHGFNNFVSFIAGWALMFGYIITMCISSFTIPSYLSYFWAPLKSPLIATAVAMGIIFFLANLNILGVRESSRLNLFMASMDLVMQLAIIALGLVLIFTPSLLIERMSMAWPTTDKVIFGIAIASIAYTGVETISQMAEETRRPQKIAPRAHILTAVTVLVVFLGLSAVAFTVMTPQQIASDWSTDPIAGIADNLPKVLSAKTPVEPVAAILYTWFVSWLARVLPFVVSLLAATILLIATNAGLMGISRLVFSMGAHQQLPAAFSKVHSRFRTPYVAIIFFSAVALVILAQGLYLPDLFTLLGGLYAFGSLMAFALAHASILGLRVRKPEMERPFKLQPSIGIKGRDLPVTAILGLIGTAGVWLVVLVDQPYSRWFGFGWMACGIVLYLLYQRRNRLSAQKKAGSGEDMHGKPLIIAPSQTKSYNGNAKKW